MAKQLTLRDLTLQQLRVYMLDPPGPEWLTVGVLTRTTAVRLRWLYLDAQTILAVFAAREVLSYSHIETANGVDLVERFDFAGLTKEFSRRSELGTFLVFHTWPTQEPFAMTQRRYTLCKWETAYCNTREGYIYVPYWSQQEDWVLWLLLSLQAAVPAAAWQEYKARICEIADGLERGDG